MPKKWLWDCSIGMQHSAFVFGVLVYRGRYYMKKTSIQFGPWYISFGWHLNSEWYDAQRSKCLI